MKKEKLTLGQKTADKVAAMLGSWRFIIIQSSIIGSWIVLNTMLFHHPWDKYPFILLNLFLSLQAAYAAPILMMSQNRLSEIDRKKLNADYELDAKAEKQLEEVLAKLEKQDELIKQLLK